MANASLLNIYYITNDDADYNASDTFQPTFIIATLFTRLCYIQMFI